jgi:endonuclease YncB( thermonuclease family)
VRSLPILLARQIGMRRKLAFRGSLSVTAAGGHMTTARLILAVLVVCLAGAVSAGERCTAIDGDTLRCGRERVRIEGIYAPSLKKPGGEQARQRLHQQLQSGEVAVERKGRDKYGRTLGRLYVNGNRITQLDVSPKSGRGTKPMRPPAAR